MVRTRAQQKAMESSSDGTSNSSATSSNVAQSKPAKRTSTKQPEKRAARPKSTSSRSAPAKRRTTSTRKPPAPKVLAKVVPKNSDGTDLSTSSTDSNTSSSYGSASTSSSSGRKKPARRTVRSAATSSRSAPAKRGGTPSARPSAEKMAAKDAHHSSASTDTSSSSTHSYASSSNSTSSRGSVDESHKQRIPISSRRKPLCPISRQEARDLESLYSLDMAAYFEFVKNLHPSDRSYPHREKPAFDGERFAVLALQFNAHRNNYAGLAGVLGDRLNVTPEAFGDTQHLFKTHLHKNTGTRISKSAASQFLSEYAGIMDTLYALSPPTGKNRSFSSRARKVLKDWHSSNGQKVHDVIYRWGHAVAKEF